jgi:hypothetical protein
MNSEIGKVVERTGRGEPISSSHRVTATTDTDTTDDTVDRASQKADAAQRTRDAEQLEALRKQLRTPITAGRFSEIARGGHGPSSVINKFFSDGEAE